MNLLQKILYQIDKLFKRSNLDNGLIVKRPRFRDWHTHKSKNVEAMLGSAREVLSLDANYEDSLPPGELQKRNGTETMSCVSQSACNCIEVIINKLMNRITANVASDNQKMLVKVFHNFGFIEQDSNGNAYCNSSDRYIAKLSGTTQRGNSQARVGDAIRQFGLVPENDWPWIDGWGNYYSSIPSGVRNQGLAIKDFISINNEWVQPNLINDYEKYGPVQLIGYAWSNSIKNGIYQATGKPANHAFTGIGFLKSLYDLIFDSYDPFKKKLSWTYINNSGMLYTLTLKDREVIKANLLKKYEGQGIKIASSPKVYLVRDGGRRWLTTKEIAWCYNVAMEDVKTVPDVVFDYLEEGAKMDRPQNGTSYKVVTEALNEVR